MIRIPVWNRKCQDELDRIKRDDGRIVQQCDFLKVYAERYGTTREKVQELMSDLIQNNIDMHPNNTRQQNDLRDHQDNFHHHLNNLTAIVHGHHRPQGASPHCGQYNITPDPHSPHGHVHHRHQDPSSHDGQYNSTHHTPGPNAQRQRENHAVEERQRYNQEMDNRKRETVESERTRQLMREHKMAEELAAIALKDGKVARELEKKTQEDAAKIEGDEELGKQLQNDLNIEDTQNHRIIRKPLNQDKTRII